MDIVGLLNTGLRGGTVNVIKTISRVMIYIAMGLVIVLMLYTTLDVFLRFAFSKPMKGTFEISRLLLACLVLGVAWCGLKGQHISVDLVMKCFSSRVQAIVDSITLLVGMAISVIITWQGFLVSIWELKFDSVASILLPVPTFPFWWMYVLGWAMLCVALAAMVIQKVAEAVRR